MTKLLNTEHVKAMTSALEGAGVFKVEKDWQEGTVTATHGKKEVFKALQKGKGQPWIVRYHDELFA